MVLGLDGATLDLVLPWAKAGLLPTLAGLMEQGAWGNLMSVVPPVSPVAWSSFLTGTAPGEHGVYDFVGRRPRTYETWLASAGRRSGTPIWGLLSQAGKRVTVFNVPLTYPAQPVNGMLVGGMLTPPGAADAAWPPDLIGGIQQHVPSFSLAPQILLTPGEEPEFAKAVASLNQSNLEVALHLMERAPWDLFVAVFMGADILSHFLWRQMAEGQRNGLSGLAPDQVRLATAIQDCYRQLDAAVGELIRAAGPDVHVIVMSDHGFGPLERYIHVNTWLLERGYLKLKRTPGVLLKHVLYRLGFTRMAFSDFMHRLGTAKRVRRAGQYEDLENLGLARTDVEGTARSGKGRERGLRVLRKGIRRAFLSLDDVDWSRTRLFSLGFAGPLYVNLKGRDPAGVVSAGAAYDALLERVTADLRGLRDPATGEPLIGEIYRREQLYQGRHAAESPDLVFLPRDWADSPVGMLDFATNRWLAGVPVRSGMHRMEGILFIRGPGIREGVHLDDSSILDIAPTVLALMGEPIPSSMSGRVLEKAMTPDLRDVLHIAYTQPPDEAGETVASPAGLTQEEEEALREHLRGMGYVA